MSTRLNLDGMDQRHRGLTPPVAASYQEAASVCLSRHHTPPVTVLLSDNGHESSADLMWTAPDARTEGAWANETDATRDGAYACVIAGVEEARGLFAVRRTETGTGADYYVGPSGAGVHDLEDCIRLEISGVDAGDYRVIHTRLLGKVAQAKAGNSSLPALAGVIGFSALLLMLRDVEDTP